MLSNPTVSPTEYIPVCLPHYFTDYFTDQKVMPEATEDVLGDVEENQAI